MCFGNITRLGARVRSIYWIVKVFMKQAVWAEGLQSSAEVHLEDLHSRYEKTVEAMRDASTKTERRCLRHLLHALRIQMDALTGAIRHGNGLVAYYKVAVPARQRQRRRKRHDLDWD